MIRFSFFLLPLFLFAIMLPAKELPAASGPATVAASAAATNARNAVEIGTLSAVRFDSMVRLAWDTRVENGNHGFEIERRLQDGIAWETIGFVASTRKKGQAQAQAYQFTDHSLFDKITYYRIKQISENSSVKYSSSMRVLPELLKETFEIVRSNPASETSSPMLSLTMPYDGAVTVSLFNVFGGRVSLVLDAAQLRAGHHLIPFTGHDLPSGVYMVKMESNGGIVTRTLMK